MIIAYSTRYFLEDLQNWNDGFGLLDVSQNRYDGFGLPFIYKIWLTVVVNFAKYANNLAHDRAYF